MNTERQKNPPQGVSLAGEEENYQRLYYTQNLQE